jgi:histidyl-tRNA synthetase
MYTFEKSERLLTLRPENTAGVVRSFIEQGMSRWPKPVKLYYIGPQFRYERPQAGRQRQFHQIGVEVFGLDTPAADAEVIWTAMRFFETLKLPNLALEINNIGTPECRERFKTEFRTLIKPYLSQLCEDCQTRYNTNPLRMLDCKRETCKAVYAQPEIKAFLETDFTSPECQAHFKELTQILDALGINYRRNPYLVRGLDYYTKTVFEITSTSLGAQNAVCGGGRYNNLVEELGGPETPAVGWALGLERLMTLVGELPKRSLDFYIVTDQHAAAFELAGILRKQDYKVEVDLSGKGFGKQLERAAKLATRQVLILGEKEAQTLSLQVKHLATGEQETVSKADFLSRLGG